jgi:regulator of protease activity HflC (stomatin/prohibitin superfamily)
MLLPDVNYTLLVLVIAVAGFVLSSLRILREYERGVVFMLGRFWKVKGPGLVIVVRGIQQMVKVDLRVIVLDVPPQDVITRDNVSVKVNAVIYFRVLQADRAFLQVTDFLFATSQFAQTTLRSVLGQVDMDDLLSQRDKINRQLQEIIDRHTEPWGVKVTAVEVKQVDLPEEMRRAMAKQAEAERERRSKVIHAEGEFQAADKLKDAAVIIEDHPMALQLRYLQALTGIATEKNSTLIFPIPIDVIRPFLQLAERAVTERTEKSKS